MKIILLAITVSLAIPAYAEPSIEDCQRMNDASEKLADVIHQNRFKKLPLSDEDKQATKQAVDDFSNAVKNFYEVDRKTAKKKSKLKSISQGLLGLTARTGRALYPTPYNNALWQPVPLIQPPSTGAATNIVTPSGMFPVLPSGNTYFMPMGFPH